MAFLHPAAFPRSHLDTFASWRLLPPPKCSLCAHSIAATWVQITGHPENRAMDIWCPPQHCLAWYQSQSCILKFSSGQRANWSDCGVCIDLIAGSMPGLQQRAQTLPWSWIGSHNRKVGGYPPLSHGRFLWFPVDLLQSLHHSSDGMPHCWLFGALFPVPQTINKHLLLLLCSGDVPPKDRSWTHSSEFLSRSFQMHFRLRPVWVLLLSSWTFATL